MRSMFCFLAWLLWLGVSIAGILLVFPFILLAMVEEIDGWKDVGEKLLNGFVTRPTK